MRRQTISAAQTQLSLALLSSEKHLTTSSFFDKCRDFRLESEKLESGVFVTKLIAQCLTDDGIWVESTYVLDFLLANDNGKFVIGQRFTSSARDIQLYTLADVESVAFDKRPVKLMLSATLSPSNAIPSFDTQTIDLAPLLGVVDGRITTLFAQKVYEQQLEDCSELISKCRNLRIQEGYMYDNKRNEAYFSSDVVCELEQKDGSWLEKRVHLDDIVGNIDGYITRGSRSICETAAALQISYWTKDRVRVDLYGNRLVQGDKHNSESWSESQIIGKAELPKKAWTAIDPRNWVPKPVNDPLAPTQVFLEAIVETHDGPNKCRHNKLPLTALLSVSDGELHYAKLPVWVGIPEKNQDEAIAALFAHLDDETNTWFEWCDDPDHEGQTMFYKWIGDKESGPSVFFRTTTIEAKFAVMHYKQEAHLNAFQHVEYDAFMAEAHSDITPSYIGGGASLNLIHAEASVFDLTLGIGVETGIGIKDDTLEVEVLGCGIMIGRKVGISVFGNSFDIDFGRVIQGIKDLID